MSFGRELPDQFELISGVSVNQEKLITDLKDLYKDRATLEKEYALKLQALARRGHEKKTKLMTALLVGDTPTTAWGEDTLKKSTLEHAYDQLLVSWDEQAVDHTHLSEEIGVQVVEFLRTLDRMSQERRTKQSVFYAKLLSERDKYSAEHAKAMQKYYEECKEFDIYRQKQGRAQGDRHAERAAKQYEHQKSEMLNHKNMYIISTAVSNTVKRQFYESDLAELENQSQMIQARLIAHLVSTMTLAEDIHLRHVDTLRSRHAHAKDRIQLVDPAADQSLFIEFNRRQFQTLPELVFEPCADFYDTGEISSTGDSKTFLQNKLARSRNKLSDVRPVIQTRLQDVSKLRELAAELDANPSFGKAEDVVDNLIDTQHALILLQIVERGLATEFDLIHASLGDDEGLQQPHNFKSASFSLPSPCAYCKASIWGLSKQGKTCKDCAISVHLKCELKVPADCPGSHSKSSVSRVVSHTPSTSRDIPTVKSINVSAFAHQSIQDELRRNAIILFEYNASSPYELSVTEGSVVQILEDDDGSGWVKVQDADGDKGLIPASYVDVNVAQDSPIDTGTIRRSAVSRIVPQLVRGLYDYTAQSGDEISVHVGQTIELTEGAQGGQNYGDGWWEGIDAHGRRGIFPSNYVELI